MSVPPTAYYGADSDRVLSRLEFQQLAVLAHLLVESNSVVNLPELVRTATLQEKRALVLPEMFTQLVCYQAHVYAHHGIAASTSVALALLWTRLSPPPQP